VVVDANITTGRGPGLVFDFALELVEQIAGKERRKEVEKGLLL
jgi:4-methyl-5(b-hydroxyethyl)-thiazole monophosphate biosynthesis